MFARRTQILCLSGGGYRGLFSAQFLSRCEAAYSSKCQERFDLFAGTSVGSLIVTALAVGIPAQVIAQQIRQFGPTIFRRSALSKVKRLVAQAPYSLDNVRTAIHSTLTPQLAKKPLSEIEARLLIVSVNHTTGSPALFRSGGLDSRGDKTVTVEDAILASAAAPTYFPTQKIGACQYVDGGLIANAPDVLAAVEAFEKLSAPQDELYMLSVGTAGRREDAAVHLAARRAGVLSWLVSHGLIQTIMSAQEQTALLQARNLFGTRLLRIDKEPSGNHIKEIKDLDRATPKSTQILDFLANAAWDDFSKQAVLRDFFER
jgi:patatin-like phospholipase/acyl hydrolase